MITVFEVVQSFCKERSYANPTKKDLINIGNLISCYFRHVWVPDEYQPYEPISDCGFVFMEQDGRAVVVNAYPEKFKPSMILIINGYYEKKSAEGVKQATNEAKEQFAKGINNRPTEEPLPGPREPGSRKRTRIPAASSKPKSKQ